MENHQSSDAFPIGCRVRATIKVGHKEVEDAVGIVVCIDGRDIGVRFDDYIDGHGCWGYCEKGHGWWLWPEHLEPLLADIEVPDVGLL